MRKWKIAILRLHSWALFAKFLRALPWVSLHRRGPNQIANYETDLFQIWDSDQTGQMFRCQFLIQKFSICIFAGQIFKAHKLILAACSKNFAELFETAPASANGSICVILEATSADNMQALLEFMYKGEVHVSQKALESFLKAAESLQVSKSPLKFI